MKVTNIRHAWPEPKGFDLARPNGCGEYILLYFHQPMHIFCDEGLIESKPNALIIYDKTFPQRFFSHELDITHDWIHIDDMGGLLEKYNIMPNHIYYPENGSFITDIVRETESEFFSHSLYCEDIIEIKLCELIAKISRRIHSPNVPSLTSDTAQKLNALRQAVFSSLDSSISVSEMAKSVSMSESRFYVHYKELFGISPAKDLIFARIQRAKTLLAQHKYSVSEIAHLAGYGSEYHFIRQFKKITGATPGKYTP